MSALVVTRVGPGASVQDLGRPGFMHHGVTPGGALVPELLVATNRAAGAADGAAAVELPLHGASFVARGPVVVAVDGVARTLVDGEELRVDPGPEAIRYVAVAGGVDVPVVLGGRGTLPVARLGGLEGRFLRKGDVLAAGSLVQPPIASAAHAQTAAVRVVVGPDDLGTAALDALFATEWRISTTFDRTGVRLDGPKLPVTGLDRRLSTPMVRGAIQVTLDGTPIVLGPDHPTTGGYPVIATVVSGDLGALARKRPGVIAQFADLGRQL